MGVAKKVIHIRLRDSGDPLIAWTWHLEASEGNVPGNFKVA